MGADGAPHATRAWGLEVLDPAEGRVRLVLPGDDPVGLGNLRSTARLALTACCVRTFESAQGKGRAVAVEDATAADRRLAARHCDRFFGAVEQIDGTPRLLLERLVPRAFEACVAVLDEWYDQTPGPGAGARQSAAL